MRLSKEKETVETTEALATQAFHVREQDMGHLLEVLRKHMYRDPIYACVREICANARDAHREVGKPNLPIRVTLPTEMSQQIEIRDWGPGISPRRMGEIFLNYGASTKRRTNNLQGAFGLGSKSPLAYANQYSVITIYNGYERHYSAYIDESRCGRMDLVKEIKTDEPNGTRVIIPVKAGDFTRFAVALLKATRHWHTKWETGVRPDVRNFPSTLEYETETSEFEGSNWDLSSLSYNNYNICSKVILDGIEYEIRFEDIKVPSLKSLIYLPLRLYFPTGKLSIAASRDELRYDDKTKTALINALNKVNKELREQITERLCQQKNLFDAELFWQDIPSFLKSKEMPKWNGFKLLGLKRLVNEKDDIDIKSFHIRFTLRRAKKDTVFTQQNCKEIIIGKHSKIFINDLQTNYGLRRKVEAYLNGNTDDIIYIIKFNDNETRKRWEDDMGLRHMPTMLASTIPDPPRKKKQSVIKPTRIDIDAWVLDPTYRGNYTDYDHYFKPKTVLKDPSEEHIYVVVSNRREKTFDNENRKLKAGICGLLYIKKIFPQTEIHMVSSHKAKFLGSNWVHLEDKILDQILDYIHMYNNEELDSFNNSVPKFIINSYNNIIEDIIKRKKIKTNSPLYKLGNVQEEINKVDNIRSARDHFNYLIDPERDAKTKPAPVLKLFEQIKQNYPLLYRLDQYKLDWGDECIQEIIDYIEMVDNNNHSLQNCA